MASQTAVRFGASFGSLWRVSNIENSPRTCHSQPFLNPNMSLNKELSLTERFKKQVFTLLALKKGFNNDKEKNDYTMDESKLVIKELSAELNRVVQTRDSSFLTRVSDDASSLEERQDFILQWAEELMHATDTEQSFEEQKRATNPEKPDKEQKLTEARAVLSDWAWKLKGMDQDSVGLGEDVRLVLKDLERQWKRGRLSSMLPLMDFIIWSMLQEHEHEGSIAKQWLKNKERFHARVALKHIPDSVWDWIVKASDDITLDPCTANPSLKLSPDRKRVKMDTIIESRHNPWHGHSSSRSQYDGWWCALGKQGFTTGRHYWEVGVRGKREWRIGVVREYAPRNGFVALDSTKGYWTLRLQLGQLLAMTSPVTKLDQSAPSRLGVFLDMEEGQVSFYDAEQKRHIYTFDADFDHAEMIYPVFGTVETDRELIIL